MSISNYEPTFTDREATEPEFTDEEWKIIEDSTDKGYFRNFYEAKNDILEKRRTQRMGELANTGIIQISDDFPIIEEVEKSPHRRSYSGPVSDRDSALDPNSNVPTGAIRTQKQSEGLAKLSVDADEDWVRNKIEYAGLTEVEARARLRARKEKLRRNA